MLLCHMRCAEVLLCLTSILSIKKCAWGGEGSKESTFKCVFGVKMGEKLDSFFMALVSYAVCAHLSAQTQAVFSPQCAHGASSCAAQGRKVEGESSKYDSYSVLRASSNTSLLQNADLPFPPPPQHLLEGSELGLSSERLVKPIYRLQD